MRPICEGVRTGNIWSARDLVSGSGVVVSGISNYKDLPLVSVAAPSLVEILTEVHHRPRSASSRSVPLPWNLLLSKLFHHHQRVKIRALDPEGTRHHAVGFEAEPPVKLGATWIVNCDI
jgi:hypothetical protein